jgi:BMFP domain-containing protein YqiC
MQTENKLFEDFVKMANGFAGTMAGAAREGESAFKEKVKTWVGGMDFVSRDEFEAVKAMAVAARDEIDALKAELAAAKTKGKTKGATANDETPPTGAGI